MKGPRHALRSYFIFIAIMRVIVQKIHLIPTVAENAIYTKQFLTFNTFVTAVVLVYPTQYLEKCTMFAHYKNILYLQFTNKYFHKRYLSTFLYSHKKIVFKITGFSGKIFLGRFYYLAIIGKKPNLLKRVDSFFFFRKCIIYDFGTHTRCAHVVEHVEIDLYRSAPFVSNNYNLFRHIKYRNRIA